MRQLGRYILNALTAAGYASSRFNSYAVKWQFANGAFHGFLEANAYLYLELIRKTHRCGRFPEHHLGH